MTDYITPAERAYRSGKAAFKKGKARSSNPLHCASGRAADNYWEWFRGFDDAADASLINGEVGSEKT